MPRTKTITITTKRTAVTVVAIDVYDGVHTTIIMMKIVANNTLQITVRVI